VGNLGQGHETAPAGGTAEVRPRRRHRGGAQHGLKENLIFTGEDSLLANLMLSVMGAFAEFERALIGERQREGIGPSRTMEQGPALAGLVRTASLLLSVVVAAAD